jgi:hypothetical protein
MTSFAPDDLNASSVIGLIESGAYPRDVIGTIARGFLPLEQNDLIAVLAYLAGYDDAEISALAQRSLGDIPGRAVFEFAASERSDPDHLQRLLRVATDQLVVEALIRNRNVPDAAIVELARRAPESIQDVIIINQARILRAPEILDALLANPEMSPDVRRRVAETREEFFDKKARILEQLEAEQQAAREEYGDETGKIVAPDAPLEEIADLLERADAEGGSEPATATLTLNESERRDEKKFAVWARLSFMTVSEKVQLAYKGDRLIRMLLVRDRNRLVCSAVLRNPRMTDMEIDAIAGMRNVDEQVLRMIGTKRDWVSRYSVMLTLCRNPKAPVGVVLPFINRLTLRDLKGLKDDKSVSQAVRENAKRFYLSRTQKTG